MTNTEPTPASVPVSDGSESARIAGLDARCGCNPAGPGPDNSWPDGPPHYDEECSVHGRQAVAHDTNTCPDEDCPACIRGCLGCCRKYVRTINGYCAQCVENEAWKTRQRPTGGLEALLECGLALHVAEAVIHDLALIGWEVRPRG